MSRIDYPLSKIKAVVFDIDGVLSPSTIPLDINGMPTRMVNIKDGYAIQLAVKQGLHIGIISGATTPSLRTRYEGLGVTDIELGVQMKLPASSAGWRSSGCTLTRLPMSATTYLTSKPCGLSDSRWCRLMPRRKSRPLLHI